MSRHHAVVATLALLALTGCSALKSIDRIAARADAQVIDNRQAVQRFKDQANDSERAKGRIVSLPWVAGRPQPLAREVALPPALRANVNTTLLFEHGATDLKTLAERIQLATGILTQVSLDALLPAEYFLPRLGNEQMTVAASAAANTDADVLVPALIPGLPPALTPATAIDRDAGPALPHGVARTKMQPLSDGKAPLASILDAIALRLAVYWRYDEKIGAIRFFRTETRTFNIRAIALANETSLELGLSGSDGSQSSNGQFASQNRSKYSSGQSKPADAVLAKVSQYLTRAGVVKSADGAATTIVVTDTKEALDGVARFIEAENRILSRSVRMVFEEITVRRDHNSQAAMDWHFLYNSIGRANAAAGNAPDGLLDTSKAAGSVGGTVGSGPFAGSKVLMSALNEIGAIVRHTRIPILASNLRPATYALRETFPYIKDLQQTQSGSNVTAPTVTVTQDEKTIGTFLTVVPNAQDDGRVLLTISYDETRLNGSLKKEVFGSSDSPSFVQQPRIGGQGAIQQVELRPGQPVVIGGYEQVVGNATRRRLDENAPLMLGGSDTAEDQRQLTVLVVTAIPEEGF